MSTYWTFLRVGATLPHSDAPGIGLVAREGVDVEPVTPWYVLLVHPEDRDEKVAALRGVILFRGEDEVCLAIQLLLRVRDDSFETAAVDTEFIPIEGLRPSDVITAANAINALFPDDRAAFIKAMDQVDLRPYIDLRRKKHG